MKKKKKQTNKTCHICPRVLPLWNCVDIIAFEQLDLNVWQGNFPEKRSYTSFFSSASFFLPSEIIINYW